MSNIELNLDSDSLLLFCQNKPVDSDDIESLSERYSLWKDFLFFTKSNIPTIRFQINENLKKEEISSNPEYSIILSLLAGFLSGNKNISLVKNANHIEINKPPFSKYNLTKDTTICPSKSFCINNGDILTQWKNLRINKTRTVSPKFDDKFTLNGWDSLKDLVTPCNSILICDNYLFSYKSSFNDNFSRLIEGFLPTNKKSEFQLVIITSVFYDYDRNNNCNKTEIGDIYKKIRSVLESKGYNKAIVTLVEAMVNETHDRHIYTNYQVLKSGHSFNYFGRESNVLLRQPTTLDIISLIAKNDKGLYIEQYINFIRYCKSIVENAKDDKIFGSKESRLFYL